MADDAIQRNSNSPPAGQVTAPPPSVAPEVNGAITVSPPSAPAPAPAPARKLSPIARFKQFLWPQNTGYAPQVESGREVVETIVFVVVLVLLLKSFAAEAFVIPTGSMAETLWGYQKVVECPECKYLFPINVSSQVEPSREQHQIVVSGCVCPNCRLPITFKDADAVKLTWNSGDRVLVAKSLYESGLMMPERFDVVVFKFPGSGSGDGPQKDHVPMNYIKRLIGLPGETIGIHYGNLYVLRGVKPDESDLATDPLERWRPERMHLDEHKATLERRSSDPTGQGQRFEIMRKPPAKILAQRRIVFDNDHPATDLAGKVSRWAGREDGGAWAAEGQGFKHAAGGDSVAWLGYRHLLRQGREDRPQLITDFMGYNAIDEKDPNNPHLIRVSADDRTGKNWVGDLLLELDLRVDSPTGGLVLELARGVDRFQARFDLATGICTLVRLHAGTEEELDKKPTPIKGAGGWHVRLANVDARLTLWVNSSLPFGNGVAYAEPKQFGPTRNDLKPASIGVRGAAVQVGGLKLWRDTYYTSSRDPSMPDVGHTGVEWDNPDNWDALRELPARTLFVQPGHYLCLGDNSTHSSDGRSWGLVPERLMLGRALLVYYPFYAPFWPLNTPVNRVGAIQ